MEKQFKLKKAQIEPLATGLGGCIASDMITVQGYPVRFMYREEPDNRHDSGWRFLSGYESDEYMEDPNNHGAYDVNTIANYDPMIIPLLHAPIGSAFEKLPAQIEFSEVADRKSYHARYHGPSSRERNGQRGTYVGLRWTERTAQGWSHDLAGVVGTNHR